MFRASSLPRFRVRYFLFLFLQFASKFGWGSGWWRETFNFWPNFVPASTWTITTWSVVLRRELHLQLQLNSSVPMNKSLHAKRPFVRSGVKIGIISPSFKLGLQLELENSLLLSNNCFSFKNYSERLKKNLTSANLSKQDSNQVIWFGVAEPIRWNKLSPDALWWAHQARV